MALCIATQMVTDPELEKAGVWHDYEGGSRLKVARHNNEEAQSMRIELYSANKQVLEAKTDESEQKAKDLECEVLAKAVLMDWEGMVDEDGNELKCDPEVGELYLKLSKDFRRDVTALSTQRDSYLVKNIKSDTETAKK